LLNVWYQTILISKIFVALKVSIPQLYRKLKKSLAI